MVEIRFSKLSPNAVLPTRKHASDSGWDLYCISDILLVPELGVVKIPTGLQLVWLSPGYELQVRPRSGNTLHQHVLVSNAPGTVDNKYRGEICVLMHCLKVVALRKGERIAQLVPVAIPESFVTWGTSLDETERGAGGFGSTGK